MAKSIEERLRANDGEYDRAEVKEYRQIPDGQHQCQLHKVKVEEFGKGKKKALKMMWQWKVLNGPEKGAFSTEFTPLEGKGVGITKTRLSQCGIVLKRLSELMKHVPLLDGIVVVLDIKTTKDGNYENRRFSIRKVVASDEKPNKEGKKSEEAKELKEDNAKSKSKSKKKEVEEAKELKEDNAKSKSKSKKKEVEDAEDIPYENEDEDVTDEADKTTEDIEEIDEDEDDEDDDGWG